MRGVRFFAMLAIAGLALLGGGMAFAQGGDTETFILQPGGTAVISFEVFCTEFGEVFPAAVELPNGLAHDADAGA